MPSPERHSAGPAVTGRRVRAHLAEREERLVVVDWAGAGRGPRLWSLGFLLWAAGARHPRLVDLVVSRYRKRICPEPEELARLEGAIGGRPLMLDCWSFCNGRLELADAVERVDVNSRLVEKIAAQARQAFGDIESRSTRPV